MTDSSTTQQYIKTILKTNSGFKIHSFMHLCIHSVLFTQVLLFIIFITYFLIIRNKYSIYGVYKSIVLFIVKWKERIW